MTQLEALKAIAARDGGLLRPQAVVDEARSEDSPLHGAFCWDDTEAARKYRLIQAQELIRSFRVEMETDGKPLEVPVFLGVSSDRDKGTAQNPYRLTSSVMKSADMMEVAVSDALSQLEALKNRYSYLTELADVWGAIGRHVQAKKDERKKRSA